MSEDVITIIHAAYVSRHPNAEVCVTYTQGETTTDTVPRDHELLTNYPVEDIEIPKANPFVDNPPKILRYMGPQTQDSFEYQSYNHLSVRLATEIVMSRGVVTRINKYASETRNMLGQRIFNDLICYEDISYVRDPAGFAQLQRKKPTYVCEFDEAIYPTDRVLVKTYDTDTSIAEQERRRENVLLSIKSNIVIARTLVGDPDPIATGRTISAILGPAIFVYREDGSTEALMRAVTEEDTLSWMGDPIPHLPQHATIRDYIASELTWPVQEN